MRKLSYKWKQYFKRRLLKIERKKKRREIRKREKEIGASNNQSAFSKSVKISIPENLNLSSNIEETLDFFSQVRKIENPKVKGFNINFQTLKNISPAAALILTAEMDRIKKVRGVGIKVLNFNKWNNNIKILLRDMGMYSLLDIKNINNKYKHQELSDTEEKFMKFQTGNQVNGDDARNFKEIIKSVVGIIPKSKYLQIGLTEAMDNSLEHAYPNDYLNSKNNFFKQKQWWMSASFNNNTKKLTIIFYDQGIGIPASLPRKFSEYLRSINLLFSKDDSKMIQAAINVGRSRTNESYRGKGLGQIKNYISDSEIKNGYLKIHSGKGTYFYDKSEGTKEIEKLNNSSTLLQGTLIEWQVCIK